MSTPQDLILEYKYTTNGNKVYDVKSEVLSTGEMHTCPTRYEKIGTLKIAPDGKVFGAEWVRMP